MDPTGSRPTLSKSAVTKAGKRLRDHIRTGGDLSDIGPGHQLESALDIAHEFRSSFARPMLKVNVSLRNIISGNFPLASMPTQRHKRLERIVQKLARPDSTDLGRIQDIAGLRVVSVSSAQASQLYEALLERWDGGLATKVLEHQCKDYVHNPKANGYRAYHLIAERDQRLVELQIRTRYQQYWADLVERTSETINAELKAEDGPAEVHQYFQKLGELFERLESGENISATLPLMYEGVKLFSVHINS